MLCSLHTHGCMVCGIASLGSQIKSVTWSCRQRSANLIRWRDGRTWNRTPRNSNRWLQKPRKHISGGFVCMLNCTEPTRNMKYGSRPWDGLDLRRMKWPMRIGNGLAPTVTNVSIQLPPWQPMNSASIKPELLCANGLKMLYVVNVASNSIPEPDFCNTGITAKQDVGFKSSGSTSPWMQKPRKL